MLPFFDINMKQLKKTDDRTIYTNLAAELIFKSLKDADKMDHSDRFDFPGVPHRMTIFEYKELAAPLLKCPAEHIKEIQFYDKDGKMLERGND